MNDTPADENAYDVDLPSLDEHFPAALPVPPLLREFGRFLLASTRGSLGYFDELGSEPLPDSYADDDDANDALRAELGIFLHLSEGSLLALWRHTAGQAPAVVLLGSEGELQNLAPTFEAFLHALAKSKTGVNDLDETTDVPSRRADLAAWLKEKRVKGEKPSDKPPSFGKWFRATIKGAEKKREAEAKAAAKSKPKRQKPVLASPEEAAKHAVGLAERVLPLIGRLSSDPEVIALLADLGVDLGALKKPDELRQLDLAALGCSFSFGWPWESMYPTKYFDTEYPKAKRAALQAERVRRLWNVSFCAGGYKSWSRASGG